MKKYYEYPELVIDHFLTDDVITASDNDVDAGDLGWFSVDGDLNIE